MRRDDDGDVNPTARWIARGVWKATLIVVIILVVAGIVTAVER